VNWPHNNNETWSIEVVLNNKIYWKLVQLGAELQQTPEEYLAMMATAELSPEDKRKKL